MWGKSVLGSLRHPRVRASWSGSCHIFLHEFSPEVSIITGYLLEEPGEDGEGGGLFGNFERQGPS